MPEHTTVATEYARAVAHPIRFRLVAALADGPRTLESIASELDVADATVRRHATALQRMDILQAIDHEDGCRTYKLRREPIIWDTAWADLPLPAKRAVAASTVTQMAASATAAVDRGGFDREDMHLTRTTIRVDETGWRELSALLGGTLHTLGDLAEAPEPDGSTGPTFQATALLMLFTGECVETAAPVPSLRPDEEKALRRIWDLSEELSDISPRAGTDWDRIHAIGDELSLLARSMKSVPGAPAQLGGH